MEWKRIMNRRSILLLLAVMAVNLIIFGYKIAPEAKKIHQTKRVSENIKTPEEKRIIKQKQYIKQYAENIQAVLDRAEKLKNNKLFSDPDSFSYHNIVKTEKDYRPLLDVELTLDNNMAVQEISEYSFVYLCDKLL